MRRITAVLALALMISACAGPGSTPLTEATELRLAPANFDLNVGTDQRVIIAVRTDLNERVGGGEASFRFAHLGEDPAVSATPGAPITATFLAVPGLDLPVPTRATIVDADLTTGVYQALVDLDRPGWWGVVVEVTLDDGTTLAGLTRLMVLPRPGILAPGDPAPPTVNLTTEDVLAGRALPQALDSRLRTVDDTDPAARLHATRISDALAAGRPFVVAFSTPVYCASFFCGPLTDHLVDLAARFEDRADFIHVEVWADFDEGVLNPAAAAWIQTEDAGNEPWVFLVDAKGTILARWDNVLDTAALEALLSELPVLAGA